MTLARHELLCDRTAIALFGKFSNDKNASENVPDATPESILKNPFGQIGLLFVCWRNVTTYDDIARTFQHLKATFGRSVEHD